MFCSFIDAHYGCGFFLLDNVTTVVLMIPITIELVKGMGRDARPHVMGEILFSNLGGAVTLIETLQILLLEELRDSASIVFN